MFIDTCVNICKQCSKYVSMRNNNYCIVCLSCKKCGEITLSPENICIACNENGKYMCNLQ